MSIIRNRSQQDNRHAIRDPFGPHACAMNIFENTLMKTRIPDLFRSSAGLKGHAEQIQQELNRLAKIENRSGEEVAQAIRVSKCLKKALIKSKEVAVLNGFKLWLSPDPFSAS